MDDSFKIPAYFYTVFPIKGKFSFTFGINSPFGLATEWPADSAVRYEATKSNLIHLQFNPSLAYAVNDKFSLGAGVVYAYSDATLEKKVNTTGINFSKFGDGTPRPDSDSKVTGNGDGWGYNLGLLFKPAEQHKIGVSYRSRIKTTITGTTELNGLSGAIVSSGGAAPDYKVDTKASLPLPESLMLGYAFNPGKWTFELDGEYMGWGSVDKLRLNYSGGSNSTNNTLLAAGAEQDFDYHNIWNFGFGTNYKLNEIWDLRGGLFHYNKAGPDHSFNPAIPDSERSGVMVGFGFNKPSYAIDFAANYDWAVDRNITANEHDNPLTYSSVGKFKTSLYLISLGYTYKFGGS
jgi:long-chain fatty acid transport protein